MANRGDSHSFLQKCVFLTILFVVHATDPENCKDKKCPGPVLYYEGLGCIPVYQNPGDCCAQEYDCSHLQVLAKDKCYANGHVYDVGETLRDEDRNSCDINCVCSNYTGVGTFMCAAVDCGLMPPSEKCYSRNSPDRCCPGPHVCLEEGEEMPTCNVDGKTYKDGEYFKPSSDPDMDCYCMPGYKGENVAPFCMKPKRPYCSPLFRGADNVFNKCVPVFYDNQNPQTDCSYASRCQNENDMVLPNSDSTKSVSDSGNKCEFGNMTLRIGEELNQGTSYDSSCVQCVCEVPPIPTCQRLPDSKCPGPLVG